MAEGAERAAKRTVAAAHPRNEAIVLGFFKMF
jgi:hypothetical protein